MMKKLILFSLMLSFTSFSFAVNGNDDVKFVDNYNLMNQKVYYVVLGSYSSLKEAKRFNYYAPDGLECNIYKARANGKIVYRACCNVFKTANEAHGCAREIQKHYGINAWVWASNGAANCVFQETGLNGEPIPILPR